MKVKILAVIKISYKMIRPPAIVYPGDILMGIVFLENKATIRKNLKKVNIKLKEKYEKYNPLNQSTNKYFKTLSTYPINHPEYINPGQQLRFPFRFRMPYRMRKRNVGFFRNWQVYLKFLYKTGVVASQGINKEEATCFLPVFGINSSSCFGGTL